MEALLYHGLVFIAGYILHVVIDHLSHADLFSEPTELEIAQRWWDEEKHYWNPYDELESDVGYIFTNDHGGENVFFLSDNPSQNAVWLYRTDNSKIMPSDVEKRWKDTPENIYVRSYEDLKRCAVNLHAESRKKNRANSRNIEMIESQIELKQAFDENMRELEGQSINTKRTQINRS